MSIAGGGSGGVGGGSGGGGMVAKAAPPAHPLDPYTYSTGLYDAAACKWSRKYADTVARMIYDHKLAPRVRGLPDSDAAAGATTECPLCFLYYADYTLNTSRCCHSVMCSECFLNVQAPDMSVDCPFCQQHGFRVEYAGNPAALQRAGPFQRMGAGAFLPAAAPPTPGPGGADATPSAASMSVTATPTAEQRVALGASGIVFATVADRDDLRREIGAQERVLAAEEQRRRSRGSSGAVAVPGSRGGGGGGSAATTPAAARTPAAAGRSSSSGGGGGGGGNGSSGGVRSGEPYEALRSAMRAALAEAAATGDGAAAMRLANLASLFDVSDDAPATPPALRTGSRSGGSGSVRGGGSFEAPTPRSAVDGDEDDVEAAMMRQAIEESLRDVTAPSVAGAGAVAVAAPPRRASPATPASTSATGAAAAAPVPAPSPAAAAAAAARRRSPAAVTPVVAALAATPPLPPRGGGGGGGGRSPASATTPSPAAVAAAAAAAAATAAAAAAAPASGGGRAAAATAATLDLDDEDAMLAVALALSLSEDGGAS